MKTLIYKTFVLFALISVYAFNVDCGTLYIQSLSEARNYILEKQYSLATDRYLDISLNKNFTKSQKSNSLLLYSLTMWKKINNKKEAQKTLKEILKNYSDTDSAGDALYFLSLMEKENSNFEESRKYLKQLLNDFPNHIRNANGKILTTKIEKLYKTDNAKIRVLLKNERATLLTSISPMRISELKPQLKRLYVKISSRNTLLINSKDTGRNRILISSGNNIISVDKKKYNGDIELFSQNDKIQIINIINLKSYLKSVVPSEMPAGWSIEALKAQAVISRSYAVHMIEKNRGSRFHLEAGIWSQVYKGIDSFCESSSAAVDATDSEIILFENSPILAAFHSNSGGITEDPSYPWNSKYQYLRSFRDIFTPLDEWTAKIGYKDLSKKLFNGKQKINDIRIIKRTPSGRVYNLIVQTDGGNFFIKGHKFREKAGVNFIKSTLFKIHRASDYILVSGRGFGHGVGMSQWGAKVMAERGFKYRDIIRFYYSEGVCIQTKLPESFKKDPGRLFLSKLF